MDKPLKLLFIDLETTGLDHERCGVIQIAGTIDYIYEGFRVETKDTFNFELKPFKGQICEAGAMKLLNTTPEQLATRTDPVFGYAELINVFDKHIDRFNKEDKFFMVGQNPSFDYKFMDAFFKKNGSKYFYAYVNYHLLDVGIFTAMFRALGKIKCENIKLETVCKMLGVPLEAHNAKNDIEATRNIFYKYANLLNACDLTEMLAVKAE